MMSAQLLALHVRSCEVMQFWLELAKATTKNFDNENQFDGSLILVKIAWNSQFNTINDLKLSIMKMVGVV